MTEPVVPEPVVTGRSGIPATERSELAGRHFRASQARAEFSAALRDAAAVTGHPGSLPRLAAALSRALAASLAADAVRRAIARAQPPDRRIAPGVVLAAAACAAVILAGYAGRARPRGRRTTGSARPR